MKPFIVVILLNCLINLTAVAQIETSHHVPVNKGLAAAWINSFYSDGPRTFSGNDMLTIGMPCGGVGAGQLYVRGDGTLAGWWIMNDAYNTGYGHASTNNFMTALGPWRVCYQTFTPFSYVDQGFTVNGRALNKSNFDNIAFTGEYPIATIDYRDSKTLLPYRIKLQVFSPFIPMDARESATPGTVLQYTITNTSNTVQKVTVAGILQNMVGIDGKEQFSGTLRNKVFKTKDLTGVTMDLTGTTLPDSHPWYGNMSLSLIGEGQPTADKYKQLPVATAPLGQVLDCKVSKTIYIKPGEGKTVTFLLTWYFPNRNFYGWVDWTKSLTTNNDILGNNYANWYKSSPDVAGWLARNFSRLQKETVAFHDAYYNHSSLPYWLTRRLMMPVSTLATETCQWWKDGKFYAWEGVGSCVGTCTHVWNYEQAMAHLFPELERNVRERTDFANSYLPDGRIITRDGNTQWGWEMDGTAGTVLKAYREDQLSANHDFLYKEWPKIKQITKFLISQDGNNDGLIECKQPNTYDIAFYGANTYVGGLYLAALMATEKMARLMKDTVFADSCRIIAERGSENSSKRLFNGEYFVQEVDIKAHPESQYGNGCLADQLFGQTWADLTDLGDIYPAGEIHSALESIWKYNWAPDVGAQNGVHPAERDYADPGEAGLFICTWPHSQHPGDKGVRYRDEVWTGIEYQVATSMLYAGMTKEALSILKGLDERYQPSKHNPWNEIECGDHYARAMASWGVLLALEGFSYNGPEGRLSFEPRIGPDKFKGFFSAAEGWGTIGQERTANTQTNSIDVRYGRLPLRDWTVKLPNDTEPASLAISINGHWVKSQQEIEGQTLHIRFDPNFKIQAGQKLIATVRYKK